MRRDRLSPNFLLLLIIALGILIGVGLKWGIPDLDIDPLPAALADLILQRQPAPLAGHSSQPPNNTSSQTQPIFDEGQELAPDGFPVATRRHVLKHTVVPGDTLFGIAEQFGLEPTTIFWANTEILRDNVNLLQVGVELYILPVDGVYHFSDGTQTIAEIAAQYGVTPGDILYSEFNQLSDVGSSYVPPAGLRIVVPGGRREFIAWQAPIRTGTQSGSANPEGAVHPGSCRAHYSGTGGLGVYDNPLGDAPYRVTTGFAAWHPGVDLAGEYGTAVYAAETGVVVFAGWHRDGYGELIILDHGDGWTTYYGHLSARFVGCGDQVSKGQIIGQMGMSGNATGIHLHFEIRDSDAAQNPYDFIPIRDTRSVP